jgi:DNA-binding GntR family transcriptional regulator
MQSRAPFGAETPRITRPPGRVYELLRLRIISGELPPGTPLSASRLAATVEASRTPVREALLRLLAEGLVVQTPTGLAVKQLTEEEIMEFYEVRVPLEAAAARLAAANVTPWTLANIQAFHEKFSTAVREGDPNVDGLAAMNLDFHRAICQATRNSLLQDFAERIFDTVGRFGTTILRQPGRLPEVLREHEQIVSAIMARDPDRAEAVARNHMERAMEIRLQMYRGATNLRA